MHIGLIDIDGGNWPNLSLMKLSAYYKAQGATTELIKASEALDGQPLFWVLDKIYGAIVFDENKLIAQRLHQIGVIVGGSGWDLEDKLPTEIEQMYPDYSLYPEFTKDTAYGFLTRGCPRQCPFCIVGKKEGAQSVKVADLSQFWSGQKYIKLLDPNLLACTDHERLLQQLIDSHAWVDFTQGVDARLLNSDNIKLLSKIKTKMIHFAWDNANDELTPKMIQIFKKATNLDKRKLRCYVLTNYNSTIEEDLYRIYKLREIGCDPYVMIYNKAKAAKQIRYLQRWVNSPVIWRTVERFEDYDHRIG